MSTTQAKKPWLKRMLIAGLLLAVAVAAVVYYLFTLKFDDTATLKPEYTVTASQLLQEYATDNQAANAKYTEKLLQVSGTVSEVEQADTTVNLKFVDSTSGSYAIFSFQEQHAAAARQVKAGEAVTIKGSCSGGIYSQILGSTAITFKRCAIEK